MTIALGVVITAVTVTLAVTAMLIVRRRAPEGSYFSDGDRASGVFGVLATGFSVLLGFIVFLAFTTYDDSRAGASAEAQELVQQVETAQFFPPALSAELSGELICYGRSVVELEWRAMRDQTIGDSLNPWGVELFQTILAFRPTTDIEQAAYDRWHDHTAEREAARLDRIHGAEGVLPSPLWVVLLFLSAVIFMYVLFFADSGEGAVTQAMLMGSVAAVVTTLLLLLVFLDSPHREGPGGLRPVAMERSLRMIGEALEATGQEVDPPCDDAGRATP